MELNALLARPVALPSLPRAVALLMSELACAEPSLRRLNQIFGSDPVLAARLLALVNSASAAPAASASAGAAIPGASAAPAPAPRQTAAIPEALVLPGIGQLRALAAAATPGASSGCVPGVNLQQFWRYSLNSARLARSLAALAHENPLAAYSAGLLHALGELVLQLAAPQQAQAANALAAPLALRRERVEQRIFGFDYAQVSAGCARRWNLPALLVDALQHHGAPFSGKVCEPLAAIVHLAAWRARAREAQLGEKELAVGYPGEIGLALGLDMDMVLQQDPIDWSARQYADDDDDDYIV